MKFLTTVVAVCLLVVVGLVILGAVLQCDHEDTWVVYSFASEDSTASSYVKEVCKECSEGITRPSLFKGTPVDRPYLEVIRAHSDGNEIVPGEYYTVTAVVTLADYSSVDEPSINCKVENEDYLVSFNVEFREEFAEAVSYNSLEEGVEITFRGRFYDVGCGFTDCELITGVE